MDWTKTTSRRGDKHLSFGIWCALYQRLLPGRKYCWAARTSLSTTISMSNLIRLSNRYDIYIDVSIHTWNKYLNKNTCCYPAGFCCKWRCHKLLNQQQHILQMTSAVPLAEKLATASDHSSIIEPREKLHNGKGKLLCDGIFTCWDEDDSRTHSLVIPYKSKKYTFPWDIRWNSFRLICYWGRNVPVIYRRYAEIPSM